MKCMPRVDSIYASSTRYFGCAYGVLGRSNLLKKVMVKLITELENQAGLHA